MKGLRRRSVRPSRPRVPNSVRESQLPIPWREPGRFVARVCRSFPDAERATRARASAGAGKWKGWLRDPGRAIGATGRAGESRPTTVFPNLTRVGRTIKVKEPRLPELTRDPKVRSFARPAALPGPAHLLHVCGSSLRSDSATLRGRPRLCSFLYFATFLDGRKGNLEKSCEPGRETSLGRVRGRRGNRPGATSVVRSESVSRPTRRGAYQLPGFSPAGRVPIATHSR